ncbi:UDP-glucose/GDP-mannose dehydrogenase family protein [Ramlibacter ginsenosidimutans]|uniref:UDP-glucose 6-dehydrogenase n=1 Tax=Ramlibacter ginsenosidimutans TaxID=502333 RepID=A0A934WP77_9BURK|nr:UDP-glucose/GDP-mannose dehydrogenase family protein [Ramlibacter ginsenosidimutans]MBK6008285.1 UDP-glucose/GDP-mannose dehydrogenase family protein [Ramlibacter ginsenosidimutans]
MNVTIVGTGYVGLVTGACLAELGNNVFCLDLDRNKIDLLNAGGIPIHEPGLEEVLLRNVEEGRLTFSCDVAASVAFADLQFIAVGTPPDEDGSADLKYVLAAARAIGRHMDRFKVIVDKSTVPVGTAQEVAAVVREELAKRGREDIAFSVASNPEFLKEGAAIDDFMRPDRIVLGVDDDEPGQRALALLRELYRPFNRNHERTRVMDVRSAEFTKYAANAMLATRISFMNELANLADRVGADIELVRQGIGSDPRIGYSFLYAGTGYGGSCFPKDVDALCRTAQAHGLPLQVLTAVQRVNQAQKHVLLDKIRAQFGRRLAGRTFAVWGLAFKPGTDDMREAPSRLVIGALLRAGARVRAHDPVAQEQAARVLADDLQDHPELLRNITFVAKPLDAVTGADALVLLTEWKIYKSPNLRAMKDAMRTSLVLDGRNLYEPHAMAQAGFTYLGIGRNNRALLPPQQRVAAEPSAAADALDPAASSLLAHQAQDP